MRFMDIESQFLCLIFKCATQLPVPIYYNFGDLWNHFLTNELDNNFTCMNFASSRGYQEILQKI